MFPDLGMTPDPVSLVYRAVLQLLPKSEADVVHELQLPSGYNCHEQGIAIVVMGDVSQTDDTAHSRDLVKINVFGPTRAGVRRIGRTLYTALTQGIAGIGLGVSRKHSVFFGDGPSFKPTGFVCTMSISVGMSKLFR